MGQETNQKKEKMNLKKTLETKAIDPAPSKPRFFNLSKKSDQIKVGKLIESKEVLHIVDDYREQLNELFSVNNPTKVFSPNLQKEFKEYIKKLEARQPLWQQGNWAYYPWLATLVHILVDKDFQLVRTTRNRNLINKDEQDKFYNSVIGIGGLSVGNNIALSLVLQGGGRHLRLADMDTLALSNTNRVRAGVQNLGLSKVDVTARQIYEINPYARIELFSEGLNKENIAKFFAGPPKLDIVVDELDNLAVKVLIREEAKKNRIAVVMATDNGDNGLVDVERYDLDPETPFFHGRMGDVSYEKLINLDKMGIGKLIIQHIGVETVTNRVRESMPEIGKTIVSWPQLGGAAILNGSAVAYCVRKILNNQPIENNRALVSLDEKLIPNYSSPQEKRKRTQSAEKFKRTFGF